MAIYLLDIGFTYFVSFAAFKNEYEIGDTTADEKKKIIKRLVFDSFMFKIVGTQFFMFVFFSIFLSACAILKIKYNLVFITILSVFPARQVLIYLYQILTLFLIEQTPLCNYH